MSNIEDRAARVQRDIESLDVERANNTLQRELESVRPEERLAFLQELKRQNDEANKKDWRLPDVEFEQKTTGLFGLGGKVPNEFTAKVDADLLERFVGMPIKRWQEDMSAQIGRKLFPTLQKERD